MVSRGAVLSCFNRSSSEMMVDTRSGDLDYIAQDAGEGALIARFPGNQATIAFERSTNDAKRTADAYRAIGGPTSDILSRTSNAVIVWDKTPTSGERSTVEGCLR